MSSWFSALSRPLIENSLKPRSSTPPVSVTRPTLTLSPPPPPPSSSPPQAVAPTARSIAADTTRSHDVHRFFVTCILLDPLVFSRERWYRGRAYVSSVPGAKR